MPSTPNTLLIVSTRCMSQLTGRSIARYKFRSRHFPPFAVPQRAGTKCKSLLEGLDCIIGLELFPKTNAGIDKQHSDDNDEILPALD
jgi:hypothetical protein